MRRRGAAAAVVEVHHRAIEIERPLDLFPVLLVGCHAFGGPAARDIGRVEDPPEGVGAHDRRGERCSEERMDERTARWHGSRPGASSSIFRADVTKVQSGGRRMMLNAYFCACAAQTHRYRSRCETSHSL